MGTAAAVDQDAVAVIRQVAAGPIADGEDVEVTVPLDRVGNLMPLNGPSARSCWAGSSPRRSACGGR